MSNDYKFGIEEEYFLVDAETKSVSRQMPEDFLKEVKSATAGQAMGEMLQSQIEVMTVPQHVDRRRAQGAEIPAPDGGTGRRQAWARNLCGGHASDRNLDRRAAD